MMRVLLSSALAAVLTTSVSGSILSTQATSCDPVAISDDTTISLDDFAKKVDLATNEACAAWSKAKGLHGSFDSAPFKLSYTGAIGGNDAAGCASALKSIIDNCRSGALYYGGSGEAQGVDYRIERAENEAGSIVHLEARVKGSKSRGGGSRLGSGGAAHKPAHDAKKAEAERKKKEEAARKAEIERKKKEELARKKKENEKGDSCLLKKSTTKKKPHGGKRELTGRAVLLDLMRQSVASPLFKRQDKEVQCCGKTLNLGGYESGGKLKKSHPDVLLFGFSKTNPTAWQAKAWKGIDTNRENVRQADTEHALEGQTVAGFPSEYLKKHGLHDACTVMAPYIEGQDLAIDTKKGHRQGTISELLADVYPQKGNAYEKEFILFDHAPNAKIKMQMFADSKILDDKTVAIGKDNDKALWYLLDVLAVAKYFKSPKVRNAFMSQSRRLGARWGLIGKALNCEKKNKWNVNNKVNFNTAWSKYMNDEWTGATKRAKAFMNTKLEEMETELKCDEVHTKIAALGTKNIPAELTIAQERCEVLSFIQKEWTGHSDGLDEDDPPLHGEEENEESEEEEQDKGTKRPPGPTPQNSDAHVPKAPKKDGQK